MYNVYILWSLSRQTYYVGCTDNLERRLQEHNTGRSAFTRRGIPWSLRYFEQFETKERALHREREIKNRKSKKYIERLIEHKTSEPAER
jgi:putative endonuclease